MVNGRDFLSRRYSFGLMMNVDWFQPFKHTNYSVGAIYVIGSEKRALIAQIMIVRYSAI